MTEMASLDHWNIYAMLPFMEWVDDLVIEDDSNSEKYLDEKAPSGASSSVFSVVKVVLLPLARSLSQGKYALQFLKNPGGWGRPGYMIKGLYLHHP